MIIRRTRTKAGKFKVKPLLDDSWTWAITRKDLTISGYSLTGECWEMVLDVSEIRRIAELYNEGKFAE